MKRATRRQPAARQSGAALLTAMIIVTLVATLATSMIWQQWRAVQVESAERSRAQSAWILNGALDWARLILREDARTAGVDHLGEPWAVPLAEARLSTFLAADRSNTDDAPEAFLSGSITDAQARYNLLNLVEAGKILPVEQRILQRLCEALGLAPGVADQIATGLLRAQAPVEPAAGAAADGEDRPLAPHSVAQLRWLGVDAGAVRQLEPYVTLLPARTLVNVNTASREVLASVIEGIDLGSAERLIQQRQRGPLKEPEEVKAQLGQGAALDLSRIGFSSSFFEIRGRLRLSGRVLEEHSLVQRRALEIVPLRRERVNLLDVGG